MINYYRMLNSSENKLKELQKSNYICLIPEEGGGEGRSGIFERDGETIVYLSIL